MKQKEGSFVVASRNPPFGIEPRWKIVEGFLVWDVGEGIPAFVVHEDEHTGWHADYPKGGNIMVPYYIAYDKDTAIERAIEKLKGCYNAKLE